MTDSREEVAEFLRQLALLAEADLPFSAGMPGILAAMPRGKFKRVAADIAEAADSGGKLSDALARHGEYFTATDIALLASAETSHALGEALRFAAEDARFNTRIARTVRAASEYQAVTMLLTILIAGLLYGGVCANFREIFQELGEIKLPMLTRMVLFLSEGLRDHAWIFAGVYLLFACWVLSLFGSDARAGKRLIRLVGVLPIGRTLMNHLSEARLCRVWAAFLRRGMSDANVLALAAPSLFSPDLRRAARETARKIAEGTSTGEAMEHAQGFSPALRGTVILTPGEQLPARLDGLAAEAECEANLALRNFEQVWSMILFFGAAILAALAIASLFLPYLGLVRYMIYL